ncbi:hypothetical protein [Erythrobacter sp.]|uniref:hypothetical protein n=1 Tax=Erythrobacter sp. TaxID=1042 RepID=UPI003C77CECB
MSRFEHEADRILDVYSRNRFSSPDSPYEAPLGTFKRESYRLLRQTIFTEGRHKIIKSIVRKMDVEPKRLKYRGNEFHFGLLAIDPHKDVLDRKRLSLWSRQLNYAHVHEVPAHLLLGFLWQSGSSAQVSQKLAEGYREPWFAKGL